jgi:hypothetical protein
MRKKCVGTEAYYIKYLQLVDKRNAKMYDKGERNKQKSDVSILGIFK